MNTAKGFVKFLELLPVLGVVKAHPQRKEYKSKICRQCKLTIKEPKRRVFCSTECHNFYWLQNQKPKKISKPQPCAFCKKEFNHPRKRKYCSDQCRIDANAITYKDYTKERNCVRCGDLLPYGATTYCSDKCKKEQQYENNRNPFSTHGTGERASLLPYEPNVMPTHSVDPDVLAQAELHVECYGSGIKEDIDEINRIIMEENWVRPARYKKTFRSPEKSGRLYWSVKQHENERRERAGLSKIPSMRYSNLEQQLIDHHKEKTKDQIQKHTKGFATITPIRTKSGKSLSEVMENAKRKQSMGST
jgi:predicted nucleic acid-binding Zn ribbon protein